MIEGHLSRRIAEALSAAAPEFGLEPEAAAETPIELSRPRQKEHGDWATNVALAVASRPGANPRDVAEAIVRHLAPDDLVASVEVAGPGFVNFRLAHRWLYGVLADVVARGEDYGRVQAEAAERVQVEFVSANPTGPLHVGHARWAAIGDALASLLEWRGHSVEREFYINDHGNQMELFGRSIAARYLGLFGREAEIPEGGYQGTYVTALAEEIAKEAGDRFVEAADGERVEFFRVEGERRMLAHQRAALERFGVRFDVWFSERSLHESGAVESAIDRLRRLGHVYERDGAEWLRTTDFGDDKDRVLIRANGEPTYLAPDVAYFLDKRARGFDRIIYLWGADHHGYVKRMIAAVRALGEDPATVEFVIGQFVNLTRAGEPVRMSKRTGELIDFDELLDEVGTDAARYTMLRQSADRTLEFDLEAVTRQSLDNPVYYVQYAHARIASILRTAADRGLERRPFERVRAEELVHDAELDLLRKVAELEEALDVAANQRAPHRLTRYAEELAAGFHRFYTECRVIGDDPELTQARLWLSWATMRVVANALSILGVSAPESMERLNREDGEGMEP